MSGALTARQYSPWVSGHCGVHDHFDCRGEYAGTRCTCECHTLKPAPAMQSGGDADRPEPTGDTAVDAGVELGLVGSPDIDLGDALERLVADVEDLDVALMTFDGDELEWCDLLGRVRQQRQKLADLESLIERQAAKLMTADIREWEGGLAERRFGKDRKEWDHEALSRVIRDAIIRPLCVDLNGEINRDVAAPIALALDNYAETNRPSWRVTKVKALGIDPDEFCHAVPGRPSVQVTLSSRPDESGQR